MNAEDLSLVLHAVLAGVPERAVQLLGESQSVTAEQEAALTAAITAGGSASEICRRMGDTFRGQVPPSGRMYDCYRAAFYAGDEPAAMKDNPLFAFFGTHRAGKVIDKWVHYFPIYHRHLAPFRGRPISMLEIGVYRGGSMQMWRDYFGSEATLVGVDVDHTATLFGSDADTIEIGDQSDPDFLRHINDEYGPFDIIVDDGGHFMQQQIISIETLFPLLSDGGVYIVEDTHTSYWADWDGGDQRPGTFIEWSKNRLDHLHSYHRDVELDPVWARQLTGLHAYDSVVVFDKGTHLAPFAEQTGNAEFLNYTRDHTIALTELRASRDLANAYRQAADREIEQLRAQRGEDSETAQAQEQQIDQLQQRIDELSSALAEERTELAALRKSRSYQVGHAALSPARWLKGRKDD